MLLPETLKSHNEEQFEFHYVLFFAWKNHFVEAIKIACSKVTSFSYLKNI